MNLHERYLYLRKIGKIVFSIEEFSRIFKLERDTTWVYLNRMIKKGLVFRISRGIYSLVDDPIITASHITYPSYLSFYTALYLYNLIDEVPNDIFVVTSRKIKDRVIFGTKVRFVRMKKIFGYRRMLYRDYWIFIAEKERLILDILKEGICSKKVVLDIINSGVDFEKLKRYARILGVSLDVIKRGISIHSKV